MTLHDILARMEKLEAKATKGPWAPERCTSADHMGSNSEEFSCGVFSLATRDQVLYSTDREECPHPFLTGNIDLIVAARNLLPHLLRLVRAGELLARGNETPGNEGLDLCHDGYCEWKAAVEDLEESYGK